MVKAKIEPTGMIFVPSKGGRSHCPEEWTDFEHIGRGVELLGGLIGEIDKRDAFQLCRQSPLRHQDKDQGTP
jgi:acetylornithine deacetylase/succinyl-diaminopimelate desuccinylase-like protein